MTPKQRAAWAIKKIDILDDMSCEKSAVAALTAIAEPSDAMIDAMKNSCWNSLTDDDARKVWRAAHAAMMAEKDTGKCS